MTASVLGPLCLLAPLVAFVLALVGCRKRHTAAMALVFGSGVLSLFCAVSLLVSRAATATSVSTRWMTIAGTDVSVGLLLDGRTLIMGLVVAVVTLCVQIYSLSYMSHDPGRGRFFAFLALFEWAMLCFVYSPSLLQTFVFWEIVGLASFFLIGFWYKKPSALAAAKKAFIMTRIGDVGLFIGLILLFQSAGTLDIVALNSMTFDSGRIELIAFLLFIGIIGKSAQFPLHTWLPDAMEGPTPVSALLHSATMVAAGVFLFARFHPLFLQAEMTLTIVLAVATFTAVLSSTMAMVAKDIKRVLAFSSISQLGFMLMGLGAGSLFAGFFHLTTHAIFKALLFLCAGAYIHHYETNDMVAIGRAGGRRMRVTTLGLVVGGAALAGVPGLSGFFSKELIIGSLSGVFAVGAYAATFMTAYYTFRMIFFIVRPNPLSPIQQDEPATTHHHGETRAPWAMRIPILVLTVGAVALGYFGDQLGAVLGVHTHHPTVGQMLPAILVALSGVGIAWLDFGHKRASQLGFVAKIPGLHTLFANGWYLDAIYKRVFVDSVTYVARVCFATERSGFDGASDALAEGTLLSGAKVARIQSGRVSLYIGVAIIAVTAACLAVSWRAFA